MASRQRWVAVVAYVLILAACTGTGAVEDPIAPPDVFAPTPTIGDDSATTTTTRTRPTPTTTIDVERVEILKVDPLTLEAIPGFDSIPMGDWMWGQPSPDGTYLAAFVGDEQRGGSEVRLINIVNWQLEGRWREFPESDLQVTDDGTIYFVRFGQLQRVRAGASAPQMVASQPTGFYPSTLGRFLEQNLLTFGSRGEGNEREHGSIVSIDVTSGVVTEIDLPEVQIGQVNPESEEPRSGYLYTTPSVVWDEAGARALVVHGDEDVISEVDLTSGVVSGHTFEAGAPKTPNVQRSSALSPDGRYLYVSGRRTEEVDVDGETWRIGTAPTGVISIDTTNWQVVSSVEATISEIYLSPGGDRIFGWGYSTEEGNTSYSTESDGLFVLDSANLEVLAHHPFQSQDQWYGPFSFNEEVGVGYVTTWRGRAYVDVVDLASGQILTSIEGSDTLEMIGSIGVLSTTASQ